MFPRCTLFILLSSDFAVNGAEVKVIGDVEGSLKTSIPLRGHWLLLYCSNSCCQVLRASGINITLGKGGE
ncbi:hypothetical protein SK128_017488 [Halocaridina rubra]|uniref:Uncharacterized protein n=1 Tax=Halocaridina rubra TaxID=373956 RepID=A0AAN8WV61_HALRR